MNDSPVAPPAAPLSASNESAAYRLVIRAEIIPEEIPQDAQPEWNKRAIGVFAAGLVLLIALAWAAVDFFTGEPAAENPASTQPVMDAPSNAAPSPTLPTTPVVPIQSNDVSVATTAPEAGTSNSKSASPAQDEVDLPPTATREVMPEASHNALQTIRGTVRVAIGVTLDQQGNVIEVTSETPGPSRYFERLSREAAHQWTFTSAPTQAQQRMLLRFHFTRDGVTGHAEPLE